MLTSKKVRLLYSIFSVPFFHSEVSLPESVFSLAALETKLVAYVKDPEAAEKPFDASSVPKISRAQAAQDAARE